MWLEYPIDTWEEFDKQVNMLSSQDWIFRGQSNVQWDIESSLNRNFKKVVELYRKNGSIVTFDVADYAEKYEEWLFDGFESSYGLYFDKNLSQFNTDLEHKLECWSLMQHHGAPTRLIDWTYSPYIALFFALDNVAGDFCVFALNKRALIT